MQVRRVQEHLPLRPVQPVDDPGRPSQNPLVEHLRPAERPVLDRERHHPVERAPLAAHGRPAGPGQQVDQEHGEDEQLGGDQAQRRRLRPLARELHHLRQSVPAREHRRGAGPAARAAAPQADL